MSDHLRDPVGVSGPAHRAVHLTSALRAIYRRRWTAITAFVLVVGAAAVHTFTQTPLYSATTELIIDAERPNVVSFQGVTDSQDKATTAYYQTQYQILQSRTLARKTIDALKIWNDPALFAPRRTFSVRAVLVQTGNRVYHLIVPKRPVVDPPRPNEAPEQSPAVDALLSGLRIEPIRDSHLVDLSFTSTDPTLAMNVVNTLAQQYIAQVQAVRQDASRQAEGFLAGQLEEQRKQVEASEEKLLQYREQHNALSLEDRQNIVVQKLADLNTAVTQAKTARLQKEALYHQLLSLEQQHQPLDTFPSILSDAYVQQEKAALAQLQQERAQMAQKLGPRHPDMIRINTAIQMEQNKLQGEMQKVVQSVKNDYLTALAQEESLTKALDQQKEDALDLNRKGIDYSVLQRDADTNRQIFESLLQRAKETGISGQVTASNVRVIDPAERPRVPSYPQKMRTLASASTAGLAMALGLVFLFEYMDNRIKTPDELKADLNLPYLGMVPALFKEHVQQPLINNGVPAGFVEAFRGIRTSVLFSSAEEGGKTLAVTSTGAGEGKTTVAANLAIALAQAGQRVLLVDADMRKPRVGEMFNLKPGPGLSNVLVGSAQSSESIRKSGVPGLWLLPCGQYPPNPSELLGTRRFKDFVATLTNYFDWTIIDTPPVMAVSDAALVAHIVTGVVFVVEAEETNRHLAQRALEQLDRANARFVGAILNRVDLQHKAYYYSQYYRREYADYYVKSSVS